jgi:hypothetical protein
LRFRLERRLTRRGARRLFVLLRPNGVTMVVKAPVRRARN